MDIKQLCTKDELLAKHNISETEYKASGLEWRVLEDIYADHQSRVRWLDPIGNLVVEVVRQISEVHAVRSRTKDPEHLVAKVIRKCSSKKRPYIGLANYRRLITDLIGVRIIHLFKSQWIAIDKELRHIWHPSGKTEAYVQADDPQYLKNIYIRQDCIVKTHKFGYRSVHYLIKCPAGKKDYTVEIQVRSLFEEAWAEVDHALRYPKLASVAGLSDYMRNVSLLSGLSDELTNIAERTKTMRELQAMKASNQIDKEIRKISIELDDRTNHTNAHFLNKIERIIPELYVSR